MKTLKETQKEEDAKAVQERPVGEGAKKLSGKQKKIMNLEEESQHLTGTERLATDQVTRNVDRGR